MEKAFSGQRYAKDRKESAGRFFSRQLSLRPPPAARAGFTSPSPRGRRGTLFPGGVPSSVLPLSPPLCPPKRPPRPGKALRPKNKRASHPAKRRGPRAGACGPHGVFLRSRCRARSLPPKGGHGSRARGTREKSGDLIRCQGAFSERPLAKKRSSRALLQGMSSSRSHPAGRSRAGRKKHPAGQEALPSGGAPGQMGRSALQRTVKADILLKIKKPPAGRRPPKRWQRAAARAFTPKQTRRACLLRK